MSNTQIQTLKSLIKKLEEEQRQKYEGKKIFGFTVRLLKDGNGTMQWRACGCYKGKRANVYIGKDADRAEEKIKYWVEKHPHFQPFMSMNS